MDEIKSYVNAVYSHRDPYDKFYNPAYEVQSVETYADNGRLLKKSVIAVRDNAVEMSQYNAVDFKIENLEAIGAVGSLKNSKLNPTNLEAIDSVDEFAEFMNDVADYNENNVNNG